MEKKLDRLIFRRQFVLSNDILHDYSDWKRISVKQEKNNWNLLYHPDLEVTRCEDENLKLILIGYLIDPYHPKDSNRAILERIIKKSDFDEIIRSTFPFNGRFVILCFSGDACKAFSDPTGFREFFYFAENKKIWCGSTPNIIGQFVKLYPSENPDIIQFRNSEDFLKTESRWLGTETVYAGVYKLQPNFYLNLLTLSKKRFWPEKPIVNTDLNTLSRNIVTLLKGTIEAAVSRHKVHMGITAGWDTRLLLSASKDFRKDIYYYVNKFSGLGNSNDIIISKKLADKFGLNFHILDIPAEVDPKFEEIFYQNNVLAHKKLLHIFYYGILNGFDDTVVITGASGNEILRAFEYLPKNIKVTGAVIAKKIGYKNQRYASDALDAWLEEALEVAQKNNIYIMDLYHMEQHIAHWGGLTASEQNIIREEIRPFNNREFIRLFWGFKSKYRYEYNPVMYTKLIRILWKDVLKVRINPSKKDFIYKPLRVLGIERFIYTLYRNMMFKIK